MPDLAQSLEGNDLGYLRIVAELWGIELSAAEFRTGLDQLAAQLLDAQLIADEIDPLPPVAKEAIEDLLANEGRLTWALFTRRYGEVREMGPGRRDRALPYREPMSAAEILWYRAMIGRAFFDTPTGPEEFAYIPSDLMPLIPLDKVSTESTLGRSARPAEYAHQMFAPDQILADACSLLAALRIGLHAVDVQLSPYPGLYPPKPAAISTIIAAAGLLDEQGSPNPGPTRQFLKADRGAAMLQLWRAWVSSEQFNELALLPMLILEGEWSNDPLHTRETVLKLLATIPQSTWWNIESFISAVKERYPDFQRPAGDYDSWFIRHIESEEYLRGFEHWDEVDGELLRFMITGPLHWLGFVDLAAPDEGKPVSAFRASKWSQALLEGEAPQGLPNEDHKLHARSDAVIRASTRVPRSIRYQIARFCNWKDFDGRDYTYQLVPASLERAARGGLRAGQLITLLNAHSDNVPPSLVKALERWEQHGGQARMEQALVLRVTAPEILEDLRNSRAARFLGDPLGPTAVIVKPGAKEKVLSALAEMGYLGEIVPEE